MALSRRDTQFQVERGVFVPATKAELEAFEAPVLSVRRAKPQRVLLLWGLLIAAMLVLVNVANVAFN